jgi:hypothetical protein
MILSATGLIITCIVFFAIAVIYASVGFGGGSSYLAILALMAVSFYTMRSLALLCNIVVVSGSTYWFIRNKHFDLRRFVPFVLTSVPLAFIGASFRLTEQIFFLILGFVLIAAALILIWQTEKHPSSKEKHFKQYPEVINYLLGAVIGLISGLVGIGGGIFLAPILYYLRWGISSEIAALASFFILVNSIAAFGGLIYAKVLHLPPEVAVFMVLSVFIGGQLGVRFSFKKLSAKRIKQLTAVLVLIVGIRVLLVNGLSLI